MRFFPVFATLVALVAVLGNVRDAAALGPTLSGFGSATVDGVISAGEYPASGCADIIMTTISGTPPNGPFQGRFCAMNDNAKLYVALSIRSSGAGADPIVDNFDQWLMAFDRGDGIARVGDDGFLSSLGFPGANDGVAVVVAGNHYTSVALDGSFGGTQDWAGAQTPSTHTFELAHPLCSGDANDFCLAPPTTISFCFSYSDFSTGAVGRFPGGCGLTNTGDAQDDGLIQILAPPAPAPAPIVRPPLGGFAAALVDAASQSAKRNRQNAAAQAQPRSIADATAAPAAAAIRLPSTGSGGVGRQQEEGWRWMAGAAGLLVMGIGAGFAHSRLRRD